jgi:hypothetical protein
MKPNDPNHPDCCLNCMFQRERECRRNPPTIHPEVERWHAEHHGETFNYDAHLDAHWPRLTDPINRWCGEHRRA